MKKAVIITLFAFVIIIPFGGITVNAEARNDYDSAYSIVDSDEMKDFLAESNNDYFEKNGIDIKEKNWVNRVTTDNFLGQIINTVKDTALKPVRVFFSLICIIIITAAFTGSESNIGVGKTAGITAISVVSVIILNDVWSLISTLVTTVKSVCTIIMMFVPVLETTLFMSGRVSTAAVSCGALLGMTQGLSLIATDYVMPIMGGYLGLGIASSLTPFEFIKQIGNALKKASVVILTVVFSAFVGITGLQTTVNAAADNLAVKTTKFVVGTFVPIGGGSLSEAANTVYSSMSLIKSSVGVYAVLSIVVVCLPVIILTLLFKLVFSISTVIAETFSQKELAGLLSAVNSLLSVVLSIALFFGGVFVFSIAIIIGLSGGG